MKMTNLLKLLFIVLLTTSLGWSAEENLGSAFPEHVQLRTDLKPKVKGVMVEATIDQIGTTQLFAGSDNVQFQVQLEFKKFKKGLPKAMAARIAKADNVTEAFAILNSSKASQTELLEGWRSHYQTKKLTRGPTAIVMPDGQIRITDGHHGGLGAAKVDQDIQRLAKTIRAKVKRIKYPVEIVEGGNYYQSSRAAAKKSGLVSTTAEYDAVAKAHRNGTAAPTGKSKTYSFLDGRTNDSAEALLSARKQGKGYLNYDNVITILGEENIKLGSSRVEAYKKIHELRKGPPSKTFADIIVDASATKGKSTTYADVIKKFQSNIGKIPNDPYRSLGGNFYFHEWEAKLSDKGYQFFNADDFVDYSQKDWAQKMKEPPNNLPDQIAKKFRGQFGKDNGGKLFKLFEEGKDIALEDISKIMSKDEFLNSNYYKNLKKLNPAKAAKLAGKLDDPLAFAKMLKNEVWDSAYQVSRDVFYSRPQNIDDLVDLLKHPKDMKNLGRVDDVKAIIAEAKLKYVDRRTKELRRLGKSQAAISIEERIASQKYNLPEMGDIKKGTRLREGVRSSGTIDRIKTRLKNLFALPDDAAKIKTPGHGGKIHFVDIELVGATQDAAGHSNVGGQVKREFDGFQKTVMRGEKLKDIKLSGKAISAKSFEDIISATKDLPASEQMKIIRSYREYYQNQKIAGRAPTAVMMPDGRIRITDGHHGGLGTARAQNTID
ncbi:MAG: hypothetical protein HOM21_02500, partial [Halobacteriovoraceae bacterium]|nr:hypothetical protein [Halobacteriovoraceae bacterium]